MNSTVVNDVVIINIEPGERFLVNYGGNALIDELLADHLDHLQQDPAQFLEDMLRYTSEANATMAEVGMLSDDETRICGILLELLHANREFDMRHNFKRIRPRINGPDIDAEK